MRRRQYAGFGEATWKITDAWTRSRRYPILHRDSERRADTDASLRRLSRRHPTWCRCPTRNETFNKVTWKGNLSYKFSESLLAYGTVSTGFRSGGLNAVSEPFEPIPAAYRPTH